MLLDDSCRPSIRRPAAEADGTSFPSHNLSAAAVPGQQTVAWGSRVPVAARSRQSVTTAEGREAAGHGGFRRRSAACRTGKTRACGWNFPRTSGLGCFFGKSRVGQVSFPKMHQADWATTACAPPDATPPKYAELMPGGSDIPNVPSAGRCPECSGTWALGTCSDLFLRLLALDHSRRQPWGAYHGVSVATYLLQHPSLSAPALLPGQWSLLNVFVDDGIAAVQAFAAARVARNRGRSPQPGEPPPVGVDFDRPPVAFPVTISDVSADGSFPAAGFEGRAASWARATVAGWTQPLDARPRS